MGKKQRTRTSTEIRDGEQMGRDWPHLLHDTPADCLFDEAEAIDDNPRPQRLKGLDKRDYDHWRTLQVKAMHSSTREERDRIQAKIDAQIERMRTQCED